MKVNELEAMVRNELKNRGFIDKNLLYREDKVEIKEYDKDTVFGRQHWIETNGPEISVRIVHRSNATEENISVDIEVLIVNAYSGHRLAKERVNTKMSEKSIMKRIDKMVDFYNAQ